MKKIILLLHLWVGLIAALFLIVIGVSGAIIAFENDLNRLVHPALTTVMPASSSLPWEVVKQDVEKQESGWTVIRFYFPDRVDQSTYLRLRNNATKRIRHIYVDQYTGRVLGSTEDGTDWIIKVHDLHVNMLGGKTGNMFVLGGTYALLVLSLSGIVLWWPRKVYHLRPVSSLPRLNADLHHTVGFWSSLAMFLFAITGLSLHYQTGKLIDLLSNKGSSIMISGHGTSIDAMLQSAQEAMPGAKTERLLLSEKVGQPIFLYMRFPEDKTPAGRSFVTLDAKTGAVLSLGSSRDASFFHTALVQWTREIHTGTIFGWPTKIMTSLFALGLCLLAITGPLIWLNKRRAAAIGRRALANRT